jgi:hypothetical protein
MSFGDYYVSLIIISTINTVQSFSPARKVGNLRPHIRSHLTYHAIQDKSTIKRELNGAAGLASHQATSLRPKSPLSFRLAFLME